MSINVKTLFVSVISFLTIISCTKPDAVSPKELDIIVSADVMTRAGYSGTETLPEKFVMDVIQNADPKYDYTAVMMEKESDQNIYYPTYGTKMLWAGKAYADVKVKAMTIPYEMNEIDPTANMTVSVSTSQDIESEILKSDLLTATSDNSDITISEDKIVINFKHQFSKLDVKYHLGSGLNASDLRINYAFLDNIRIQGEYNYSSMSFVESVNKTNGSISMYHNTEENLFEAIFVPYKPSVNPRLVVYATIQGVKHILTCAIAPNDANGFECGKRYMINVTINSDSITTTSVGIANGWDTIIDENVFDTL
jgi:hypothetical protein